MTWTTIAIWVLLLFITLVMLGKEIFQMMHAKRSYLENWENWMQMAIIVNVALVSFHANPMPALDTHVELVAR